MSDPSANSSSHRIAVVMAGGSGERFWPVSTPTRPKQLLRLASTERTMIEEAVDRLLPLVGKEAVFVSTTAVLADPIADSEVVERDQILAEPLRRNTLGALVWIVASLIARGEANATIAIMTADHAIGAVDRFSATVRAAMDAAELTGGLVTIGVPPDRPETGYGYIERDESEGIALPGGRLAYAARSFREKPDAETAELYLRSGQFLWNAGMFFFTIDGFRKALSAARPEAAVVLEEVSKHLANGDREGAKESFSKLESISFDYAVMETAETVHVVPSDFPWDDVGAWDAIARTIPPDEGDNVLVGPAAAIDSQGCIVYNDSSDIAVGICGLEDVVVVVTATGVLVCRKGDVQRVRDIGRAAQAALSKDA